MLLLIMVVMGNICYRWEVCALWLFSIERGARMFFSQTGRIAGESIDFANLPAFAQTSALFAMTILLLFVTFFFFSEKQITSPWGVVLKRPLANDRELYMEKNRLGLKCSELSQTHGLTAREAEILPLIVQGRHLSQIADELGISSNTIKTHMRHIYEKLEIHSRSELMEPSRCQAAPLPNSARRKTAADNYCLQA